MLLWWTGLEPVLSQGKRCAWCPARSTVRAMNCRFCLTLAAVAFVGNGCDIAALGEVQEHSVSAAAISTSESRVLDTAMPKIAYCDRAREWELERIELEEQVLAMTNQMRAQGATCGDEGVFGAAPPLVANSVLNCPARTHSLNMRDLDFFSHSSPSGETFRDRIEKFEYRWFGIAENIAAGYPNVQDLMAGWMSSPGHCANIMNPDYTQLGVGYAPGGSGVHYWTQVFANGDPRPPETQLPGSEPPDPPPTRPAPALPGGYLFLLGMGGISLLARRR